MFHKGEGERAAGFGVCKEPQSDECQPGQTVFWGYPLA